MNRPISNSLHLKKKCLVEFLKPSKTLLKDCSGVLCILACKIGKYIHTYIHICSLNGILVFWGVRYILRTENKPFCWTVFNELSFDNLVLSMEKNSGLILMLNKIISCDFQVKYITCMAMQ